jgi:hypothetical protein
MKWGSNHSNTCPHNPLRDDARKQSDKNKLLLGVKSTGNRTTQMVIQMNVFEKIISLARNVEI